MIELLKPRPIPAFAPETEEMKKFHEVAGILKSAGIYGEENMMITCDILNLKGCGDNNESFCQRQQND